MYDKTYKSISRLEKEYFVLLCSTRDLRGTYDVVENNDARGNPCGTFTIAVSGRETYNVMQRVFDAANG